MNDARLSKLAGLLAAAWLAGCAVGGAPALPPEAPSSDDSTFCESLHESFVGLPALASDAAAAPAGALPLAGSWWVRSCSAVRRGEQLKLRLRGPGWYFVDEDDGNLALRQQVPFDLMLELDGRLRGTVDAGVVSVWLEPSSEPKVELSVVGDLAVRASSSWGAVLQALPLVSVQDRAAQRFATTASKALREKLREGATMTYHLGERQADATLGHLAAGQVPQRAFDDGVAWLVNERLILAPHATHVVGPITPGPTRLDVLVEEGAGLAYQALCAQDMGASFAAVAAGELTHISQQALVARGTVEGPGPHTSDFRVDSCKFYLLVSPLRGSATLASLRVRA